MGRTQLFIALYSVRSMPTCFIIVLEVVWNVVKNIIESSYEAICITKNLEGQRFFLLLRKRVVRTLWAHCD